MAGIRENPVSGFAWVNAEVVASPSQIIVGTTILIEGASITTVVQQQEVPAGYQIIDGEGKIIYLGLIDAWSALDVTVKHSLQWARGDDGCVTQDGLTRFFLVAVGQRFSACERQQKTGHDQ